MALQTPASSASGATDTNATGVQILKNQLKPSGRLKLIITSDGTGNQSNQNILIFQSWTPGNAGIGANKPDGTHINITSPQLSSSVAEVQSYLQNVKMHITKMTISTSDTSNWNNGNMLTLGKVDADGRVTQANDVMFNDYKVSNGQTLNDTITIDDVDFTTGGNFFMKLGSLALNSSITIWFDVAGTNDNAVITARA